MIRCTSIGLLGLMTLTGHPAQGQDFGAPATPIPPSAAHTEPTTVKPDEELLPLDRHTFDPPMPATVRKTSGTVLRGLWLGIEPEGVRFQTEQGALFTYENKTVRTIRTLDGRLSYSPGKDELEKAVAAARLAFPKIVRQAPEVISSPAATVPGRGAFPGPPPGFSRPMGGSPFGGSPFSPGGPSGAHQSPSNAAQGMQNAQGQAHQQMADMQRRQQETMNSARQSANRAFEQIREQLDGSRQERWEGGRQVFEYEYRCRHCNHTFRTADPSLGGTPCPKCHPSQAQAGALAGSASGTTESGSGSSSWVRIPRGAGKLVAAAVSGIALLAGAVMAANRSGSDRPKRRKRRAKSDEYEDY